MTQLLTSVLTLFCVIALFAVVCIALGKVLADWFFGRVSGGRK